jgi:hypothetical protein
VDAPVLGDAPLGMDAPACVPPPTDPFAYFAVGEPCTVPGDCPTGYLCQTAFDADGALVSTCQIPCEPVSCPCASGFDCFPATGPAGSWSSCLPL